jgi:uncharacterized protein (TIGR03435 family)
MGRTVIALITAGLIIWGGVTSLAQSKPRLAFEVASVRAYPMNGQLRNLHRTTGSRVDRIRPMSMLLPGGATVQQVPEMLQTLLEERFGLVTHREARPIDAYELVVAPGGIKMKEVEPLNELDKEVHLDPLSGLPQREVSKRETPNGIVRDFQVPGGGFTRMTSRSLFERRTVRNEGSILTATRMTIAELLSELELTVDGPIVDRTGLGGLYQFSLRLPEDAALTRLLQRAGVRAQEPFGGPSTFKALEGIGLKLERGRFPVETIVVDRISRTPTEN